MSVHDRLNRDDYGSAATDGTCFKCSEALDRIYVLWRGETDIGLHPKCAQDLGMALVRDGMNAEFVAKGADPGIVGVSDEALAYGRVQQAKRPPVDLSGIEEIFRQHRDGDK